MKIDIEHIAALIHSLVGGPKIRCISSDCRYHNNAMDSWCSINPVYLRQGCCRYYRPGEIKDRTDIPLHPTPMETGSQEA